MFKNLVKLFAAINSNTHPAEIAHAVCLALIMGFMPKNNSLWYLLMAIFLFIRIHKPTFVIYTFIFSFIAPLLDSLFDIVGYWFLTLPFLRSTFDFLLEVPFIAFTKFNNTVVMGSLIISLVAYIPLYFIARLFIRLWRNWWVPFYRKTKLAQFLSKLPWVEKLKKLKNLKKIADIKEGFLE